MTDETALPWPVPDPDDRSHEARRQRHEILAEWTLADPATRSDLGMPATQKELARALGVGETAISQWKKSAEFHRVMRGHLRQHFNADRMARVVDNLYEIATSQTTQAVPAARALFDWMKTAEAEVDLGAELADLSDEEIAALLEFRESNEDSENPFAHVIDDD